MNFEQLSLIQPILQALSLMGHTTPTLIQEKTIPATLSGSDVIGYAQTGTGKTGAFLLPILQLLEESIGRKALILAPTRELAAQIGEQVRNYSQFLTTISLTVYGGTPIEQQIEQLKKGVDLLIATPGRLLDLTKRGAIDLAQYHYFVLDEADRMLDLGFQVDLNRIIDALPDQRQSMLFSATMPQPIEALCTRLLKDPVTIRVSNENSANQSIEQLVYHVEQENKPALLKEFLHKSEVEYALVFTKTRGAADKLHALLEEAGFKSDRLHSDRAQMARDRILNQFRNKELPILIATDIAARGIDIEHITHVFNYELPQEAQSYVHRIGRTGRAGRSGKAITLCTPQELPMLTEIRKLTRYNIPVKENHTFATLSLKKSLTQATDLMQGKAKEKKSYQGSKANGDYFRRKKIDQKKGK